MTEGKVFRLTVLFAIFIIFWVMGLREHQGVQSSSTDAIHLPRLLGMLFGRSSPARLYSIRGIIGQLLSFSIAVIYSLNILEYIPDSELAKYFLITGLMLSLLWLLLFLILGRK